MAVNFKGADINDLNAWFSTARLSRYASAKDPAALYAWDVRLAKAYLEDVAHVEVLLRNFMSHRLARDCENRTSRHDCRWFDYPELYGLNASTVSSIEKAKVRLSHEGKIPSYDRVIAALTFDMAIHACPPLGTHGVARLALTGEWRHAVLSGNEAS